MTFAMQRFYHAYFRHKKFSPNTRIFLNGYLEGQKDGQKQLKQLKSFWRKK